MNWWADKLSGKQTVRSKPEARRSNNPPIPEAAPPPAPAPHTQRLPASAMRTDHCPSCGSVNYMAAPGSQYKRCYDCGHPVTQSGTGVGGTSADAPTKQATQVKGGGFNPTQIVGKVE